MRLAQNIYFKYESKSKFRFFVPRLNNPDLYSVSHRVVVISRAGHEENQYFAHSKQIKFTVKWNCRTKFFQIGQNDFRFSKNVNNDTYFRTVPTASNIIPGSECDISLDLNTTIYILIFRVLHAGIEPVLICSA